MSLTVKGERTRQAILEGAAEIIRIRGLNGLSIDEIAEHCSVNKATIYRYFESKECLGVAVQQYWLEITVRDIFEHIFKNTTRARERLYGIYDMLYAFHHRDFMAYGMGFGCPISRLMVENSCGKPEFKATVHELDRFVSLFFSKIVVGYMEEHGVFDEVDDDFVALVTHLHYGSFGLANMKGSASVYTDTAVRIENLILAHVEDRRRRKAA